MIVVHDMNVICTRCDEPRGEHSWSGMCPLFVILPNGEKDYDHLIGFGGSEFSAS